MELNRIFLKKDLKNNTRLEHILDSQARGLALNKIMRWKGHKHYWEKCRWFSYLFRVQYAISCLELPLLTCPPAVKKWVSCFSSSPAYPAAPHEQSTSVYLEDRCFDDHLPPIALWIHLPLHLLSHLQLQSCFLTYMDCSPVLPPESDFWVPNLWFSVTPPRFRLPPSTSPSSCVTFQQWALAVSILGGAMPPCEGDNDCYHECEVAEQTMSIYYRARWIRERTGDEKNSVPWQHAGTHRKNDG